MQIIQKGIFKSCKICQLYKNEYSNHAKYANYTKFNEYSNHAKYANYTKMNIQIMQNMQIIQK